MRGSWVFASLVALGVAGAASQARADDFGIEVRVQRGYPGVLAVTIAARSNGVVAVPRGTVMVEGSHQYQDVATGVEIHREMRAGERVTIVMPAFCLHQERPALRSGTLLRTEGPVRLAALQPILSQFEKSYGAGAKVGRDGLVADTQHRIWDAIRHRAASSAVAR